MVFDRVLIMPGDLIYADSSGAVVIPATESVAVVTLAREIAGQKANALEQIADEEGAHHCKLFPRTTVTPSRGHRERAG